MAFLFLTPLQWYIPPNPIYGLRTSATCDDEWVWFEANAQSGREIMIGGSVVIAIGLEIAKVSQKVASLSFGIATVVLTLGLAIRGIRTANRLKLLRDQMADDNATALSDQFAAGSRSANDKRHRDQIFGWNIGHPATVRLLGVWNAWQKYALRVRALPVDRSHIGRASGKHAQHPGN